MSEKVRPLSNTAVLSMAARDNKSDKVKKFDLSGVFTKATDDNKQSAFKEHAKRFMGNVGAGFVAFRAEYKARAMQNKLDDYANVLEQHGYAVADRVKVQDIVATLQKNSETGRSKIASEKFVSAREQLLEAFSTSIVDAPEIPSEFTAAEVAEPKLSFKDSVKAKSKSLFVQPFMNMYATVRAKLEADKIAKYKAYLVDKDVITADVSLDDELTVVDSINGVIPENVVIDTSKNLETPVEVASTKKSTKTTKEKPVEKALDIDVDDDFMGLPFTTPGETKASVKDVKAKCENASKNGLQNQFETVLQMLQEQSQLDATQRDYDAIAKALASTSREMLSKLDDGSTKSSKRDASKAIPVHMNSRTGKIEKSKGRETLELPEMTPAELAELDAMFDK